MQFKLTIKTALMKKKLKLLYSLKTNKFFFTHNLLPPIDEYCVKIIFGDICPYLEIFWSVFPQMFLLFIYLFIYLFIFRLNSNNFEV